MNTPAAGNGSDDAAGRKDAVQPWDYLIVTASNEIQAAAYRSQLELRRRLGLVPNIGRVLVVADLEGKRIGSGGSTLLCLMEVLSIEQAPGAATAGEAANPDAWEALFARRRILIIHAGGDSRRLPAYGPCGKIFVPVPDESDRALSASLFDRQLPIFMRLARPDPGQVVVTSGDALIYFDSAQARFDRPGITALGSLAALEQASKHGVFCADAAGQLRLYLQKPAPTEQRRLGAVNLDGQSILDIGVMSFDAGTVATLLRAFEVGLETRPPSAVSADQSRAMANHPSGSALDMPVRFGWSPRLRTAILEQGLDLYREICCALGTEATPEHHWKSARASGSKWDARQLAPVFDALAKLPVHVQILPDCQFLHFGTTRQLISSGLELRQRDRGTIEVETNLMMNHWQTGQGRIQAGQCWIEACRINAPVHLAGPNVLVGADVDQPLDLPPGACVDLIRGRNAQGESVCFIRLYDLADTFKDTLDKGATFCGQPMLDWLRWAGVSPADVWDPAIPAEHRSLWDARVFPAEPSLAHFHRWLWMFNPAKASEDEKRAWHRSDRYSVAQMAVLADQDAFYQRRYRLHAQELRQHWPNMIQHPDHWSAPELAFLLEQAPDRTAWIAAWLAELVRQTRSRTAMTNSSGHGTAGRFLARLGGAIEQLAAEQGSQPVLEDIVPGLARALDPETAAWLASLGLEATGRVTARNWARRAGELARSA